MKTLTALSRSDNRVVLALWSNLIVNDGQEYRDDNGGDVEHDDRLFADKQRRQHLAYALDQLHGEVWSIIVTRKPGTIKETIESQEVGPAWRVTKFNPKTGALAWNESRLPIADERRLHEHRSQAALALNREPVKLVQTVIACLRLSNTPAWCAEKRHAAAHP